MGKTKEWQSPTRRSKATPEQLRALVNETLVAIEVQYQQPAIIVDRTVMVDYYEVAMEYAKSVGRFKALNSEAEKAEYAKRFEEATVVEFDYHFSLLPDERLFDLSTTFRRFRYEKVRNISFAAFVKAVISGRWQENIFSEPASTIEPSYKLPVQMRYGGLVEMAIPKSWFPAKFLPVTLFLVVGTVMFWIYVIH